MKTLITISLVIICIIIIYKVMKAIEEIYNDNFNGPPAY
jgi:hypothetical protein